MFSVTDFLQKIVALQRSLWCCLSRKGYHFELNFDLKKNLKPPFSANLVAT